LSLLVEQIKVVLKDVCLFVEHSSGLKLREYQVNVARVVAESVIFRQGKSFVVMFPRQSGKNELQAQIETYLLTLLSQIDCEIVKISPTWKPQSLNAMRRLQRVLENNILVQSMWKKESGYIYKIGKARIFFFSGSPEANIVGATAGHLLEVDEAQDVLVSKFDKDIAPMAASTNATRVFWGTAWTSDTLLARELRAAKDAEKRDGSRRVFVLTAEDVAKKGVRKIVSTYEKMKSDGKSLEEIDRAIKELYAKPKYSHLSRWNKVDEFGIFIDSDLSREGGPKDYTIINPFTKIPCKIPERGWGKSYEELLQLQENDLIWYGEPDTPPRLKNYITEDVKVVPDSFLYFDNSVDTRMIKNMFGSLVFKNPKPVEMIKQLIEMSSEPDSVILDFFAGSGTTGHAVLELNSEDGGNRQFILITNNENDICEQVCYPRLKNHITGYINQSNKTNISGLGGSLKFYQTNFIGQNNVVDLNDEDLIDLAKNAGVLLALAENTLFMINELSTDYYQFFMNDNKFTAVYFSEELVKFSDFKQIIINLEKPVTVYIFSWSYAEFNNQFYGNNNVIVKSIPQPIIETYKTIYQLRK